MLILAIAWIYTVGMMAIAQTSVVAGVMTFLVYCVIPLSLVTYLQRSKMRKARNEHLQRLRERQAMEAQMTAATGLETGQETGPQTAPASEPTKPPAKTHTEDK